MSSEGTSPVSSSWFGARCFVFLGGQSPTRKDLGGMEQTLEP